MAHQSYAKTVLDTLRAEANKLGGEVNTTQLANALFIQTRKDNKRMLNTLSDLRKRGAVIRVSQGVYGIGHKKEQADKREIMWRTLRMRKVVTIADLQEFADVSADYAKQWLRMLLNREIVMRIDAPNNAPSSWRLVKDLPEMPVDTEKAARLRKIRKNKKRQLLKKLGSISEEIEAMKTIINQEEE